ncbi:coagulation factor 5/8 type domain protein [Desulfitobacterium hafniense DCB-2]|uniref:Coagulation factor 5/8 type domain protein n=1 Tax=Desulfitobacterium hafniense (strain DSM 10664 / DCB-2) TaxID=272564 RepID=B8FU05_DESHD|nr:cadherin-like beta sandwich domain-containing protein [Desulfitobacterium hafniense]ACL18554.1 coagulation factor 5/8 type domain protein [Desulfitobacterium hafniense DCB-2]
MAINLALKKPTISSSYLQPYEPARAVNGDYMTPMSRWLCTHLPGWLTVDLGEVYSFDRWVVRQMPIAGWPSPDYCMSDFTLQGSNDAESWADLDNVAANTSAIVDRMLTAAASYRYVRIYVAKGLNANDKFASLMEFEIYQAPPSLAGLIVKDSDDHIVELNPAFNSNTDSYKATVLLSVASVTLIPTVLDSSAVIKVNSMEVVSGTSSAPITINVGTNQIEVSVTVDGVTKIYTIEITKAAAANPYLKAISITGNNKVAISLDQTFDPKNSFNYTALADYDDTSATVVLTADDPNAKLSVNGGASSSGPITFPVTMSSPGDYSTAIVVEAADGTTTQSYSLKVTRPSSAYISSIDPIPAVTFIKDPGPGTGFVRDYYNYKVVTIVAFRIKVFLEDYPNINKVSFQINSGSSTDLPHDAFSSPIPVPAAGSNFVTITVTSQTGGATKKYIIEVSK